MLNLKKVVTVTALTATIGLASFASASDYTKEIVAFLNPHMKVSINGNNEPNLSPITVDGKSYLPIRDLASKINYSINWNEEEQLIELNEKQTELAGGTTGVLVHMNKHENGTTIEVMGNKMGEFGFNQINLRVTDETEIIDLINGTKLTINDLYEGVKITTLYGAMMTKSLPPTGTAEKIYVIKETVGIQGTIESIDEVNEYKRILVNGGADEDYTNDVVLTIDNTTKILSTRGETLDVEQLKDGMEIKGYYGPIQTMSLPPQSHADTLIVQVQENNIED